MATFLQTFLPPFKRHLAYGKFYKCTFFEWDEKQGQIIPNKTRSRRFCILTWAMVDASYVGFKIVNILYGSHALVDKFAGVLIAALQLCCFMARLEFEPDLTPVGNINRLINGAGKGVSTTSIKISHQFNEMTSVCQIFIRNSVHLCFLSLKSCSLWLNWATG